MSRVAIRGPLRPSKRALVRHPDQLTLPIPRPSARTIAWEPGDPVHEPPAALDPDPRPAVLTDDVQPDDAATWRPGLDDGPGSGLPAGDPSPLRAGDGPPVRSRPRSLLDLSE